MATDTPDPTVQLQDWTIVGFEERWHQPFPDVPRKPGATCWKCSEAIGHCVIIENNSDHRREIIGSQCAERVGMDIEQLRRYMDQYKRDRADRQRADNEAALAAEFGEHGTPARFESGCHCDRCAAVAPHGTWIRWREGCRCIDCAEGLVTDNPGDYRIEQEYPVIVELATGRIVDAEVVQGHYGSQWKVRASNGYTVYLARFPKRRTTHTGKGFVEATACALVDNGGRNHRLLLPLSDPLFDNWGEPIPHPAGQS